VFVIYPMGYAIYRAANIPRTRLPGAIAFSAFGVTMTTVPGTPQIQNLIPMQFYHTTPTAAPVLSLIAMVLILIPGYLYLSWVIKLDKKELKGFEEDPKFEEAKKTAALPSWHWVSGLLPLISVVVVLNVFKQHIVPSLLSGILICIIMNIKQWKIILPAISSGANGSLLAIMNTSSEVGFGAVVRLVPGFAILTKAMMNMPGNILFSQSVAVNTLAGVTGSASGGMSTALTALGPQYLEKAQELAAGSAEKLDYSCQLLHRIASLGSGGLDTLPHNGAVFTLLAVTNCTHKTSYKDIFVATTCIPTFVSLLLALVVGFTI